MTTPSTPPPPPTPTPTPPHPSPNPTPNPTPISLIIIVNEIAHFYDMNEEMCVIVHLSSCKRNFKSFLCKVSILNAFDYKEHSFHIHIAGANI